MDLSLDRIEIDSFKSIDSLTIDFSKYRAGLHYILGENKIGALGSNGAGKSSIWDALCWCWTGKTPDGLRGPDVKAWGVDRGVRVGTVFYIDKDYHTVVRTTDPNRLMIDGKTTTQEDLYDLLKLDYDLLINAIILAQGKDLFFDMLASEKMEMLSAVQRLERWEARSARAAVRVKALDKLTTQQTTTIENLIDTRPQLLKQIEQFQTLSDNFAGDVQERIEPLDQQLAQAEARLAVIEPRLDEMTLSYDGALTELKPLKAEIDKNALELRAVERNHAQFEAHLQFAENDLADLYPQLSALNTSRTCPVCNQTVTPKDIAFHKKEVERKIAQHEKAIKEGVPPATRKKLADLKQKETTLREAAAGFQKKVDEAHTHLITFQAEVAGLKQSVKGFNRLKKELQSLENVHYTQLMEFKRQLAALDRTLEKTEAELASTQALLLKTEPWVNGFKDVRLYLIEGILNELQFATNATIAEVGLDDWRVEFAIESETKSGTIKRGIAVTILSPFNKHPVKWENWSGGEGQRLRIIGAHALSDVLLGRAGVRPSFELLDEHASWVSVEGIHDLCDYLANRAKSLQRCIFYVDHQAVENARFTSTTTVTRSTAGTQVTVR